MALLTFPVTLHPLVAELDFSEYTIPLLAL